MIILVKLSRICLLSLGIVLLWGKPNNLIVNSAPLVKETLVKQEKIIAELTKANIVYLGEIHDNPQDHQEQLIIIKNLATKKTKIAIALEMFQRPSQKYLDAYIAEKISEEQLKNKTEYEEKWGFPWEYYAPILRFAREKKIPLLALNTPTEITRKVARQGLESLSEIEKRAIPPLTEINLNDQEYRQYIRQFYEKHQQGNSKNFEKFFAAQVLWDETMAETIAQYWQNNPQQQIIVLAGRGHIIYGYGIPNRVARRLSSKKFIQRSVFMGKPEQNPSLESKSPVDYFWH